MLYVSGIILSLFLSFLLFTKASKSAADYILAVWLAFMGGHLLCFYMLFTGQYTNFPGLVTLGFSLPLAHGPFLYLYTYRQTSASPFNKKQLLHFIPMFLSMLLFVKFHFLPAAQKAEIIRQQGAGFELQMLVNRLAIYASGIIYAGFSLVRLLKYRKNLVNQFSNTEKINFNWLLYLIVWMAAIWVVVLLGQGDEWIFGVVVFFIVWLGYFGIKQVRVFNQQTPSMQFRPPTPEIVNVPQAEPVDIQGAEIDALPSTENTDNLKYQKSPLNQQVILSIHQRLKLLMAEQKPFRNPDLTLNDLAAGLQTNPNYLSQVINSCEGKSFYDLINESRVEEFKMLAAKPQSRQYTLLSLAFECGFNSKASFNRNFKKYTGFSPSDYMKSVASAQ